MDHSHKQRRHSRTSLYNYLKLAIEIYPLRNCPNLHCVDVLTLWPMVRGLTLSLSYSVSRIQNYVAPPTAHSYVRNSHECPSPMRELPWMSLSYVKASNEWHTPMWEIPMNDSLLWDNPPWMTLSNVKTPQWMCHLYVRNPHECHSPMWQPPLNDTLLYEKPSWMSLFYVKTPQWMAHSYVRNPPWMSLSYVKIIFTFILWASLCCCFTLGFCECCLCGKMIEIDWMKRRKHVCSVYV